MCPLLGGLLVLFWRLFCTECIEYILVCPLLGGLPFGVSFIGGFTVHCIYIAPSFPYTTILPRGRGRVVDNSSSAHHHVTTTATGVVGLAGVALKVGRRSSEVFRVMVVEREATGHGHILSGIKE